MRLECMLCNRTYRLSMPDLSRSYGCKVCCPYLDSFQPSTQAQNSIFLIKHFFPDSPNLPRMSEKQVAGRSKKSRWMGQLRSRLDPLSRRHSRHSSRAPSPVPSRGEADNASATAGASCSTPRIGANWALRRMDFKIRITKTLIQRRTRARVLPTRPKNTTCG